MQAAEGDDEQERASERPAERPVLPGVEDGEGGGAREHARRRSPRASACATRARARRAPRRGRARPGSSLSVAIRSGYRASGACPAVRRPTAVERRRCAAAVYRRAAAWPRLALLAASPLRSPPSWPPPAAPPAGAAPRLARALPGQPGFGCGTLQRAAGPQRPAAGRRLAPALRRRGAARPPAAGCSSPCRAGPGRRRWPGRVGVRRDACSRALRRYRLVVLDQRGTGRSGALSCPSVQRLRSLDPFRPAASPPARRRVGPRRAFYSTADTRAGPRARCAPRSARQARADGHLLRHARRAAVRARVPGADRPPGPRLDRRPRRARRLPARHAARRCRACCASSAPAGAARASPTDPVADVRRARARGWRSGPIAGRAFDARGRSARTVRYAQRRGAALPAHRGRPEPVPAGGAARRRSPPPARGDAALLLRLRRVGQGAARRRSAT